MEWGILFLSRNGERLVWVSCSGRDSFIDSSVSFRFILRFTRRGHSSRPSLCLFRQGDGGDAVASVAAINFPPLE